MTEQDLLIDESLFTTSNKRFGVRGTFAEGTKSIYKTYRECVLNGVYETYPYCYGERGYGYPNRGEFIITLPDFQTIYVVINGEKLNYDTADIKAVKREFNTTNGHTIRTTKYLLNDIYEFTIKEERITPFDNPNLYIAKYDIKTNNFIGEIDIISTLTNQHKKNKYEHDPRFIETDQLTHTFELIDKNICKVSTIHTNFHVYFGLHHSINMTYSYNDQTETMIAKTTQKLTPKNTVTLTKYVIITSSVYETNPYSQNQQMIDSIKNTSITAYKNTVDQSIFVKDNKLITTALNYNLYQLNASGPADEYHSIPAKGLSGKGYEGHYFWDTEMYMFPYFLLTKPKEAKKILLFRYNTLKEARQEALNLNHDQGVKFPWRTIDGKEVSSYYPAGSAQYHINGIIAIQFLNYYFVTNDLDFLLKKGMDVIYQTALLYLEIGSFHNNEFHINTVTGPDEYSAIVNNNYYTNKLAQYHIKMLLELYSKHKRRFRNYDSTAIKQLKKAAEQMVIPYDKTRNINPQDSQFLSKKPLDLTSVRKPLLLNMHPLTIYRYQVCKQADTILAHMLLNDEPYDTMCDSLAYYEGITIHDSSLSKCIFSVMNSRLGDLEKGYKYFKQQLLTDLDNTHNNTEQGLHIANMGGTYLTIVYGFLGLHISSSGLSIAPKVPKELPEYTIKLRYRGASLTISIKDLITIKTDKEIQLEIYGKKYLISDKTRLKLSSNAYSALKIKKEK